MKMYQAPALSFVMKDQCPAAKGIGYVKELEGHEPDRVEGANPQVGHLKVQIRWA
jgi:hypothetical protein